MKYNVFTAEQEEILLSVIPEGEENAVSMKKLAKYFGTNDRQIRAAIQKARNEGEIIAGTSSGYFRPKDEKELIKYYRLARSRAISCLIGLKTARKALKNMGVSLAALEGRKANS